MCLFTCPFVTGLEPVTLEWVCSCDDVAEIQQTFCSSPVSLRHSAPSSHWAACSFPGAPWSVHPQPLVHSLFLSVVLFPIPCFKSQLAFHFLHGVCLPLKAVLSCWSVQFIAPWVSLQSTHYFLVWIWAVLVCILSFDTGKVSVLWMYWRLCHIPCHDLVPDTWRCCISVNWMNVPDKTRLLSPGTLLLLLHWFSPTAFLLFCSFGPSTVPSLILYILIVFRTG